MLSSDEELEKAKFYNASVLRLEEATTKAYEHMLTKIQIMLGIVSAIIPITAGVGYYILSNTFSLFFFFLFVSSLSSFILATVRGVTLLDSKWFQYKDLKLLVERYVKESLSFMIFRITTNLFDANEHNVGVVNSLSKGLKQMVILTIVGLLFLTIAFSIMGVQLYSNNINPTNSTILIK